ncbi:MAG: hypothetical protein ACK6D3_12930 [Planctomycetaceae bacterium]
MRALRSMELLELPPGSPRLDTEEFRQFMQDCFPLLRNSDGSWKCSRASRLRELDERLITLLQARPRRPCVFMDVGMGNGTSTLDTIRRLERVGLKIQTIATDRNLVAYVVRLNRQLDLLAEVNGHILMIEGPGWSFSPVCNRWDYLTGKFLFKKGITAWARRRLASRGLPLTPPTGGLGGGQNSLSGPFLLVTPELKARDDVVIRQDDILEPLPADLAGVADVVRIANVLRPDRFSPAQLRQIAANLRQRCREGALLLVGRHLGREGEDHKRGYTFFEAVRGGGFQVLERVGRGSEVERYFVDPGAVGPG